MEILLHAGGDATQTQSLLDQRQGRFPQSRFRVREPGDLVLQRHEGNVLHVLSNESGQLSVLLSEIYPLAHKLKSEEF